MNIGIIGSGEMGACLASKLAKSGHTVSISNSRGPASLQKLAGEIGVEAATVEQATKNKEVIIVSIPQKSIPGLPKILFQDLAPGLVVIDTGNYYPTLRDGVIPSLERSGIDSEWVSEHLCVPVVKVFNSILATSIYELNKPKGDTNRIAIAVSGNSKEAKDKVLLLVDELGFDPFDLGELSQSWKQQPGSPIYCRDISLHELKKRVAAMGKNWDTMRQQIIGKRKSDEALMKADYAAYLRTLSSDRCLTS